jgi:hypothetical protein
MSANVEERVARLEGVFEQVGDRLNSIDARLTSMDDHINGRFGQVEGRFAQIEQKIDSRFAWMLGVVLTTWMTTILTVLFHR